jgi:hypothetical protein
MCGNLANRTTITKMALYPCGSGKLVIKSMYMQCHDYVGACNVSQPSLAPLLTWSFFHLNKGYEC